MSTQLSLILKNNLSKCSINCTHSRSSIVTKNPPEGGKKRKNQNAINRKNVMEYVTRLHFIITWIHIEVKLYIKKPHHMGDMVRKEVVNMLKNYTYQGTTLLYHGFLTL